MLIKAKEVAELLNVSQSTVYKWVDENAIPYIKIGTRTIRFDKDKVIEVLGK